MADRIFKGRLITTGDIHEENQRAFPEASESFGEAHKGGLEPYQTLYDIFKSVEEYGTDGIEMAIREDQSLERVDAPLREINRSIWLSGDGCWIKIDPDGSFEIGTSGV